MNKKILTVSLDSIFCLCIAIVLGIYSIHLGQDTNGDVWNYHWYNAYSYLNNRLFYDLAPADAHSYFNPYLDVLFYLSINHLPAKTHMFIMGFLHGLVAFPIFGIVSFFLAKEKKIYWYFITLLCCFGSIFFLGQLGTSMQDNTTALLVLMALFLLLKNEEKQSWILFITSALLVGIATAFKMTNAIYMISFTVVAFFLRRESFILVDNIKIALIYGLCALSGLLLVGGYWFWNLYVHFQNPVFPYYNYIFHSPFASTAPDATKEIFVTSRHGLEKFFYPFYFADNMERVASAANKADLRLYSVIGAYIFIPMACLAQIYKNNCTEFLKNRFFLIFISFFASYFIWQKFFGVYRYFMVMDLLIPLFVFCSFIQLIRDERKEYCKVFILFLLLLLVGSNFKGGIPTWGRGKPTMPYMTGDIPLELKQAQIIFTTGFFSAWQIPIIDPVGHVIPLGNIIFNYKWENNAYKNKYYDFIDKTEGEKYIIFDKYYDIQKESDNAEAKLKRYKLKIDFNSCKDFTLRISEFNRNLLYCKVIKETK